VLAEEHDVGSDHGAARASRRRRRRSREHRRVAVLTGARHAARPRERPVELDHLGVPADRRRRALVERVHVLRDDRAQVGQRRERAVRFVRCVVALAPELAHDLPEDLRRLTEPHGAHRVVAHEALPELLARLEAARARDARARDRDDRSRGPDELALVPTKGVATRSAGSTTPPRASAAR
jgi:hypothetical protein